MIKIYSNISKFDGIDGILYIDPYFNVNVSSDMLSEKTKEGMLKLEDIKVIGNDVVEGRFGVCTLNDISTGLKVFVVLRLIFEGKLEKPNYISLTECGNNILPYCLKMVDNLNIPILLLNTELEGIPDFSCILDDTKKISSTEILIEELIKKLSAR